MLEGMDAGLLFNFFIILIVMSVATGLYYEIDTVIRFVTATNSKSGFLVSRVRRPAVKWYYIFLILSLVAGLLCYFFYTENDWIFAGFVALIIGFSLYGLLYQLCFINPVGLGQVSRKMEMEIQWDEIESYQWEKNVLHLRLKNRNMLRPRFHFFDSGAIVAVNEYLSQTGQIRGLGD